MKIYSGEKKNNYLLHFPDRSHKVNYLRANYSQTRAANRPVFSGLAWPAAWPGFAQIACRPG
jgi:hypothetical protein